MAQIISTLTSSFIFVQYGEAKDNQLPPVMRRIRIAGGANTPTNRGFGDMTSDHRGTPMWTPRGVITTVDDEDMKWLGEDAMFKQFIESGLIQVATDAGAEFKHDHRKLTREVEANMSAKDTHAPLVPGDKRLSNRLKTQVGPLDNADNDENLI